MSASSGTPFWVYAALLLTGSLAAYGLSTSLSLRAELAELRSRPEAAALPEAPSQEPKEPLGVGSDTDRLVALEDAVRRQENEIGALRLRLVAVASNAGDVEVGPDGELTGPMADSVLTLIEKERQRQQKERQEQRFETVSARIAEQREAFAAANNLSSKEKEQLVSLEDNTKKVVKGLMEELSSGAVSWRELRPQANELAADTVRQLNEIMGEQKATAYLDMLQSELPMIARWRERLAENPVQ